MATPTSNFTEPTFVSRYMQPVAPVLLAMRAPAPYVSSIPSDADFSMFDVFTSNRACAPLRSFRVPPPPMGKLIISTLPVVYKDKPLPPTISPPVSNTEWNILWLQKVQLSKDNFPNDVLDVSGERNQLAELSMHEGHMIPFVIRTGPVGKPDPGILKRYTAIEVNGEGRAFVMAWVQGRLVAWGTLFAQESPRVPRRLAIKRGLGNGYDIDIYIAFQGRLTGYEIFYEVINGDQQ